MDRFSFNALANVIDLLVDAICVVDAEGRFLYVSGAGERIFGYRPEEMLGRRMIELVHPDDRDLTLGVVTEIMAGELQPHFENRYIRKDGEVVHIMWSARWSEADQVRITVARDITQRKRAEAMQAALYAISEAAHSAGGLPELFARIHGIVGDLMPAPNFCIALYDADTDLLTFPYYVDERRPLPQPRELAAFPGCEAVIRGGQTLFVTPENPGIVMANHNGERGDPPLYWLGVPLKTANGILGALVLRSYAETTRYSERDTELLQFVSAQIAAATERRQLFSRLQFNALYDPLTRLPNRALFHDRLQSALARARREGQTLALLFIDLDNFKTVNDNLGHAAGDQLLQQAARRLEQCVRASDTVARFGGDEFVVLLDRARAQDGAALAAKIHGALVRPFELAGEVAQVTPSIGIAVFPDHGEDESALLDHADSAMYRAKRGVAGGR
ncbi:MAG: diguanylate cyclase [Porticoccaceae bacterium]|jgi:diguanylate cyclase (GGDEF)-like protein/PAS domain S-box-containing protein|nr:diguanylate cyclase [Porticoccaceae bacterium]